MLSLQDLKPAKGSTKKSKRRGRGNSSGRGNFSTRGMKGQRARSGGKSGLQARSIKGYLLRIPKVRGFQSLYQGLATVNLEDLEKNFQANEKVNWRSLLKKRIIRPGASGLKILSQGSLTKKLQVEADAFSKSAKEKIIKVGGQAIVSARKQKTKEKTK